MQYEKVKSLYGGFSAHNRGRVLLLPRAKDRTKLAIRCSVFFSLFFLFFFLLFDDYRGRLRDALRRDPFHSSLSIQERPRSRSPATIVSA